jgi:hypothetical protein
MFHRIEVTDDGNYKIIIEHDMGNKYSYLIKEISRYLLGVASQKRECCHYKDLAVTTAIASK